MKIRITSLLLTVVTLLILLPGCGKAEAELEITSTKATEEPEMMVPKNANLYFPRPNGDIELQVALNFCWDEDGYLARIEADRISEGKTIRLTQYFKQKTDGWYSTIDFLRYTPNWDDLSTLNGPFELEPGQCKLHDWWYQEDPYLYGMTHAICTKITAESRNYQNPSQKYNEFSGSDVENLTEDTIKQMAKTTWADLSYWYDAEGKIRIMDDVYSWKYVNLQYDEYGNAIRIDTYDQDDKLSGYIEVEWASLDLVSKISVEPTMPTSIMVPKVSYFTFLEENGGGEWNMVCTFTWDVGGYLTKVDVDKLMGGKKYHYEEHYIKQEDGWYRAPTFRTEHFWENATIEDLSGPWSRSRGEWGMNAYGASGIGESVYDLGFNRTIVCAQITENSRYYYNPNRIYNNIPNDYTYNETECRQWLYADFTYDEFGNAIRIDTYNLEEELCGYVETEWMGIEIQP